MLQRYKNNYCLGSLVARLNGFNSFLHLIPLAFSLYFSILPDYVASRNTFKSFDASIYKKGL